MQKIHIPLNKSKQLVTMITAVIIATQIIIIFLPCTLLLKLFLTLFVLVYGSRLYHQPIIALTRDHDSWQLHEKNKTYSAELCGSSTLTRYLCILRFKIPGKYVRRSCIILPDSLKQSNTFAIPSSFFRALL